MKENQPQNHHLEGKQSWMQAGSKTDQAAKTPAEALLHQAQENKLEVEAIDKTGAILFDPGLTKKYPDIKTQEDALLFLSETYGSFAEQAHEEYMNRVKAMEEGRDVRGKRTPVPREVVLELVMDQVRALQRVKLEEF